MSLLAPCEVIDWVWLALWVHFGHRSNGLLRIKSFTGLRHTEKGPGILLLERAMIVASRGSPSNWLASALHSMSECCENGISQASGALF
jgi:hypothetical protein